MALRPPEDFRLAAPERGEPSATELRELWRRHEAARERRERAAAWRDAREGLRRDPGGALLPAAGGTSLGDLCERLEFGSDARAALRPLPEPDGVLPTAVGFSMRSTGILDGLASLGLDI